MKNNVKITWIRRNLYKRENVLLQGAVYDTKISRGKTEVCLDGKPISAAEISFREGRDVWALYRLPGYMVTEEITIQIPEQELEGKKSLEFFVTINGEKERVYKSSVKYVAKCAAKPLFQIDELNNLKEEHLLKIRGWAAYDKSREIYVTDLQGKKLEGSVDYGKRRDVEESFSEIDPMQFDGQIGFIYSLPNPPAGNLILHVDADGYQQQMEINPERDGNYDTTRRSQRMLKYLRYNGPKAFMLHAYEKVFHAEKPKAKEDYMKWASLHEPTIEEIEKQRDAKFNKDITFSIAVPLYNTPVKYLQELIDSVVAQTYPKWELCLADGSSNDTLEKFFQSHYTDELRIKYKKLEGNLGIAGNTNAAIDMASGEHIVLADHDDIITPNALYELMRIIDVNEDADVIYTDEDKIDMKGKLRFDPYFKSGFNIDLLCSNNYICHMFSFSRELYQKVGGFRQEFDGAQDHDFILRCVEQAQHVYHVPMVLYHWRCHVNSTASNPASKLYAYEAGLRAVQDHFDRIGVDVKMEDGLDFGFYHPHHIIHGEPLVSILIPNKDHTDDLDQCIRSIEKSSYKNYEIIVIENNSTEDATWVYYEALKARARCKVVYYEGDFNFSKINNFGAEYAEGDYLLFLNNDIEAITENWLEEMIGFCQREDVGIVGAQLFYPDQTLQHAGVVVGIGGIAGHTFVGQTPKDANAFGRANSAQDYSAVTAACMLTKTEVFHEVGGFDESLKVAFNDIDYCLKVRATGRLVVYNPKAQLYHYESKSRGYEDTPEKQERFAGEIDKFKKKWPEILRDGDPYYNPNLTLEKADMSLTEVL